MNLPTKQKNTEIDATLRRFYNELKSKTRVGTYIELFRAIEEAIDGKQNGDTRNTTTP